MSGDGIATLQSHPFFRGLDHDNIYDSAPPLFSLPNEPVQYTDDASALELTSTTEETQQNDDAIWSAPSPSPDPPSPSPSPSLSPCVIRQRFLLDDEKILFHGLVSKRRGIFAKRRQLLLTSIPRFIYIDPSKMKRKGVSYYHHHHHHHHHHHRRGIECMQEIPWSSELYAEQRSSSVFYIHTVGVISSLCRSNFDVSHCVCVCVS